MATNSYEQPSRNLKTCLKNTRLLLGIILNEERHVPVGEVRNFDSDMGMCVIELTEPLQVGDRIVIKGATTDFKQKVESMQIDKEDIASAEAGKVIGLKVKDKVSPGDIIYRIE